MDTALRCAARLAGLAAILLAAASPAPAADPGYGGGTAPPAAEGKAYSLKARAGVGYDTNVFLTPDDDYVDYSVTPALIIDPGKQSGGFIPLSLYGSHTGALGGQKVLTSLTATGEFYPDSDLRNGDEYYLKLRTGPEFLLHKAPKRETTLYVGPFAAYRKEIYIDPDTGLDQTSSGVSVADRYTYFALGLEAALAGEAGPLEYKVSVEGQKRDYKEVPVTSSLDQKSFIVGGTLGYKFTKATKAEVEYELEIRDYDERPSRNLDGDSDTANVPNPFRHYTYHSYGVSLRHRLPRSVVVNLDYTRTTREDDFVGYHDYTQDKFRVRATAGEGRTTLRATLEYRDRDYDKAFAFDLSPAEAADDLKPAQPTLRYKTWEAVVKGEMAIRGPWGVWADYEYRNRDSTDPRYEYVRHKVSAGVKWEI